MSRHSDTVANPLHARFATVAFAKQTHRVDHRSRKAISRDIGCRLSFRYRLRLRGCVKIPARGRCLAIGVVLLLVSSWPFRAEAQGVFDMSATDVTIFVPETKEVIGHGHYEVSFQNGLDVVAGENKYFNGEYDSEHQTVQPSAAVLPPVLVSYRHQFFNP